MAAIVYQTNKKTGITYAYESISCWDKEKQQSRAKRKCIGKVDPITKEIVPTRKKVPTSKEINAGYHSSKAAKRSFYGATLLFDKIGEKIGLTEDLKNCFPDTYKEMLSVAYYLILEDKNPLSRFPKWAATHNHPYGENIPSQRSSDLFSNMSNDGRERFFFKQGKRRAEKEFWAYDTTSISSYSKCLKQVKFGVNKDHDPLPQINLAMLFGETSGLPFYYRKLAGNITDVKTVKCLLKDMDAYGFKKVKLVMDRGFYSEANVNYLYKDHRRFLMATKTSLIWVQKEIKKVKSTINSWGNYLEQYNLYVQTVTVKWDYKQDRPLKKDTLKEHRRMYLHIYYNYEKKVVDKANFHKKIIKLKRELESGKRNSKHEKQYEKYFNMSETTKKGIVVTVNEDVISEEESNFGYFTLISNDVKDAITALEIYRNKDLVEKGFNDLKGRLDFRKPGVSSDLSLDGKLFVEFIALIFLSYIKKQMQEKEMFSNYTMQEVLDELDLIECFERPGHKLYVGEVTKKQIKLFGDMEIAFPTSLL